MRQFIDWFLPVAVCLLGSSCGTVDPDGRLDELQSHREQWHRAAIRHYRMEFRASCTNSTSW